MAPTALSTLCLRPDFTFRPLGGNRCDCAVVASGMLAVCCDDYLPGDVLEGTLAVLCSPPLVTAVSDKLDAPCDVPVTCRLRVSNADLALLRGQCHGRTVLV